ncbi:MAG TPA: carboxypeptidase-like regulatory domain-containing protein [Bryobacteraceae bacterium]
MIRLFAAAILSALMLNAQSKTQGDPTYRPAPMYSKSEKKKMDKFRMVHGIVKDQNGNPLSGALVNLKNLKTKQLLTFITKADGKYMFDGLSREQDYEISASFSGKSTPVKKLSHYDPQTNSMRILSFAEQDENSIQAVRTKK